MADELERLGRKRKRLLAELEQVRDDLIPAMQEAAAQGRSRKDIMAATGYAYEQVRQALDPEQRKRINSLRRKRRADDEAA